MRDFSKVDRFTVTEGHYKIDPTGECVMMDDYRLLMMEFNRLRKELETQDKLHDKQRSLKSEYFIKMKELEKEMDARFTMEEIEELLRSLCLTEKEIENLMKELLKSKQSDYRDKGEE